MRYKTKVAALVIVNIVIWGVFFAYGFKPGRAEHIPVRSEFDNKVVYTIDLSENKKVLIKDCRKRGGSFNSCGTPCALEDDLCTTVCAYTCEW